MAKNVKTICLVGYPGSGKSQVAALFNLYAHQVSKPKGNLKVFTDCDDPGQNVLSNTDKLQKGQKLLKSPSRLLEDKITLEFPVVFMPKKIVFPILDTSGEVLRLAMNSMKVGRAISYSEFKEQLEKQNITEDEARTMHEQVFKADAYIFTVNLAVEMGKEVADEERPAVDYVLFLQNLATYRKNNDIPRIRKSAIVFTKYDQVESFIDMSKSENVPLCEYLANNAAGMFRAQLIARCDSPPELFYSFTREKDDGSGKFIVEVAKDGWRNPVFPVEEYDRLLAWIRGL